MQKSCGRCLRRSAGVIHSKQRHRVDQKSTALDVEGRSAAPGPTEFYNSQIAFCRRREMAMRSSENVGAGLPANDARSPSESPPSGVRPSAATLAVRVEAALASSARTEAALADIF